MRLRCGTACERKQALERCLCRRGGVRRRNEQQCSRHPQGPGGSYFEFEDFWFARLQRANRSIRVRHVAALEQHRGAIGNAEQTDVHRYPIALRVRANFEGAGTLLALRVIGRAQPEFLG